MKAIDFLKNIINESSTPTVSLKAEYGTAQWNAMLKRGIRYYLRNAIGAEICFAQVQSFLPEIAEDLGWDKSESKVSSPRNIKPRTGKPSTDGISISKSFDDLLVDILMSIDNETDNKRKMKMISRISDLVTTSVLRMSIQFKNVVENVEVQQADEVIEAEEIVDQSENEEAPTQPCDEIPAEGADEQENNGVESHDDITTENDIKTDDAEIIEEEEPVDPRVELIENVVSMLDATGFTSISFGGFDFIKRDTWMLGKKKIDELDVETLESIKAAEGIVESRIQDNAINEYAETLEETKEEADNVVEDTTETVTEEPKESKAETKEDLIKEIEEILRNTDKEGIDLENKCRFTSGKVTAETTSIFLKKDELNLHVVCVDGYALGQERTVKATYKFVTIESLIAIRDEIKENLKK